MATSPTIFTANGTFTPDAGVTSVTVKCWGGGGAGGSLGITNGAGGAGGGAGGSYSERVLSVTPGVGVTVTVGATQSTSGGTGNRSWFLSNDANGCVAIGGPGAANVPTGGGFGAGAAGTTTGCVGDTVFAGGNGSGATSGSGAGAGGGGAGTTGAGGNASGRTAGTGTTLSGGGGSAGRTNSGVGSAGSVYGGAGSGAYSSGTNSSSKAGGAGAAGRVEVHWTTKPDSVGILIC